MPDGTEILVAQTPDPDWSLVVDGEAAARRRAIGWANAYLPVGGGEAVLEYDTPWWRRLTPLAQIMGFAAVAATSLRRVVWGGRSS